jgi:hypothetical protein
VSSSALAALGAFLSGVGSVLGAWFVLRSVRKRMEADCAERIRLLKEGIEIAEHIKEGRQ